MKRWLGAGLLVGVVIAAAGACDSPSSGGVYGSNVDCTPYTTCGTCTPVQGCGWCFTRAGGVCANDPDQCASSVSEFTWTWDPAGCPGVEAGVVTTDAGTSAETSTSTEAGLGTHPEASAPETSTASDAASEAAPTGDAAHD